MDNPAEKLDNGCSFGFGHSRHYAKLFIKQQIGEANYRVSLCSGALSRLTPDQLWSPDSKPLEATDCTAS